MTEGEQAIALANKVLDRIHADPDDDLAVLARQFLRSQETIAKNVHVPGMWRCAKCQFVLVQSNLNATDGTITARDTPGDKCPNCNVPLWRLTWREHAAEMAERLEAALTPSTAGWLPMASAPKDGTHVLLATAIDPPAWVCEGYYETAGDRGWYQANTHWTDAHEGLVYPSNWQPLPEPPAPEQEGASESGGQK